MNQVNVLNLTYSCKVNLTFYRLCLYLSNGLCLSGIRTKPLHAFIF